MKYIIAFSVVVCGQVIGQIISPYANTARMDVVFGAALALFSCWFIERI